MKNSFASNVKDEIARSGNEKACCAAAEIMGFIRACGSVTLVPGAGMGVRMTTGSAVLARRYKSLIESAFGVRTRLMVGEATIGRPSHVYELYAPPGKRADELLVATGAIKITASGRDLRQGFEESMIRRKCCRKACLKGLFLGAGTIKSPEKGYGFEITLSWEQTAAAVRRLMNSFTDIHSKVRRRRGSYVVYLKDSEQIKDILAIMGAHSQLLKYEKVRMIKNIKERTNRVNNCDVANMERALSAAERQLSAIREIESRDGLDSLPDELIDTALTRIFHPDATLSEIGAMLDPPIGKAAASARFKQIAHYASL
jgi:DNA-binding protein WhiA